MNRYHNINTGASSYFLTPFYYLKKIFRPPNIILLHSGFGSNSKQIDSKLTRLGEKKGLKEMKRSIVLNLV